MRAKISKKGNLSLSINAIVVLIMAITMLGLGLAFIRGTFGGATKQFTAANEQIEAEMINEMKSTDARFALKNTKITMKKGEEREVYYAIKNDGSADAGTGAFALGFSCNSGIDGNTITPATVFKTFTDLDVAANEVDVFILKIKIPGSQTPDTFQCTFDVTSDSATSPDYASEKIFLTVE